MKIIHHHFNTQCSQGGALYFYSEISRLLGQLGEEGMQGHRIDFVEQASRHEGRLILRLLAGLKPHDVVFCNAGPYGHLYHYLREKAGSRFRIIRDVRTSSWGGFLLQEALAGPLTRPGDLVLFPSEFCRAYFLRLFGEHLSLSNTAVCYPLTHSFPVSVEKMPHQGFNVGYIGRISGDKNFDKVLDIFTGIYTQRRDVQLHLAGPMDKHSKYGSLERIAARLKREGIPANRVTYDGQLPYDRIWSFFAKLDLFVFPALSSVESLGRVLLEARHARVPVISVDYAAAGELLPSECLIQPIFDTQTQFNGNRPFSYGAIDVAQAVHTALHVPPSQHLSGIEAPYRPETLFRLLRGEHATPVLRQLSPGATDFLERLSVSHAQLSHDAHSATVLCEKLFRFFQAYNHPSTIRRTWNLLLSLPTLSHSPESFALRYDRLTNTAAAFELRHAREFCREANFHPVFQLQVKKKMSDRLLSVPAGAIGERSGFSPQPFCHSSGSEILVAMDRQPVRAKSGTA